MSSCNDCGGNGDLVFNCCDSYTGQNAIQFRQCGRYWPTGDCQVSIEFKFCGSACGNAQFFEADGIYNTTVKVRAMLDTFDDEGRKKCPDVFEVQAPASAVFDIDSSLTCRMPRGFRSGDYRVIVTDEDGARTTVASGRVTVQ